MTRKKVKLAWIQNDSARRASLRKRRAGLLKKVSELSTLCGVDASIVIYSPDEIEPTVWPSHAAVQEQFMNFKNMPELERLKKMNNQDTYLRDRISKTHAQLSRTLRKNKESQVNHLMIQIDQGKNLDELNLSELSGLTWFFNEKMKEVNKRIEFHRQIPYAPGTAPPPQDPKATNETTRLGGTGNVGLEGDNGRTQTEALLLEQWLEMMKNKALKGAGSSSTRSEMGYPYHPFSGSIVPDDHHLELPRHVFPGSSSSSVVPSDIKLGLGFSAGNFRGPSIDMVLPPLKPHAHGGETDHMGLQLRGSRGGSHFGPLGSKIGMDLGLNHSDGHIGNSFAKSGLGLGLGLTPLGHLGSSNNGTSSDVDVPFDGKTESKNSS
ncbi:Transcription factor, MADS-box [Corchorus capsularis]|uniref:Transcription factor, MADS-box n=1 Tax=Corchorus capsularis TaxID=210143 RepID=A0A1R3HG24_COCAP|nr:Transcription factor, MADS-box [Corchorus capsularis]